MIQVELFLLWQFVDLHTKWCLRWLAGEVLFDVNLVGDSHVSE